MHFFFLTKWGSCIHLITCKITLPNPQAEREEKLFLWSCEEPEGEGIELCYVNSIFPHSHLEQRKDLKGFFAWWQMKHGKLNALGYYYSSCVFTPYTQWWLCNLAKLPAGITFLSTQRPTHPSQYKSQVAFIKWSTTPRPTLEWLDELLPSSLSFLCQLVLVGEGGVSSYLF